MYPAIGGTLSRLSVAAALDTDILGSECTGTQDASSQRNKQCAKNAFPNSLFHGKVLSVMYDILPVTFSVRNHPNQSRPNRGCPHRYRTHPSALYGFPLPLGYDQ